MDEDKLQQQHEFEMKEMELYFERRAGYDE